MSLATSSLLRRRALSTALLASSLALTACGADLEIGERLTTELATSTTVLAPAVGPGLPPPSGPDAVGLVELDDTTRAWYPAEPGTGTGPAPYVSAELAVGLGLDPADVATVSTSAELDALPRESGGPRPVVVLSPGFGSVIELSTGLAVDLASRGYVVLATQPDLALELGRPTDDAEVERFAAVEHLIDLASDGSLDDRLGELDPARIAVGGHSYAGSIAYATALVDGRVAAVFDLDGTLWDEAGATEPKVPALAVLTLGEADHADLGAAGTGPDTVVVGLLDAFHFDVTDAPAVAPLLKVPDGAIAIGGIGPVATTVTVQIVGRFLDAALGASPTIPDAATLAAGLPSVDTDPLGSAPAAP